MGMRSNHSRFADELCCADCFVEGIEVTKGRGFATYTLRSALDSLVVSLDYARARPPTSLSCLAPPRTLGSVALQYPRASKGEVVGVHGGHTRRKGERDSRLVVAGECMPAVCADSSNAFGQFVQVPEVV